MFKKKKENQVTIPTSKYEELLNGKLKTELLYTQLKAEHANLQVNFKQEVDKMVQTIKADYEKYRPDYDRLRNIETINGGLQGLQNALNKAEAKIEGMLQIAARIGGYNEVVQNGR